VEVDGENTACFSYPPGEELWVLHSLFEGLSREPTISTRPKERDSFMSQLAAQSGIGRWPPQGHNQ
jgi:hypothetical protein